MDLTSWGCLLLCDTSRWPHRPPLLEDEMVGLGMVGLASGPSRARPSDGPKWALEAPWAHQLATAV